MKQRARVQTPRQSSSKLDSNTESDLETLESLVDELTKPKPQEERIRAYMRQVGIEYTADPIEQLNSVLQALDIKTN